MDNHNEALTIEAPDDFISGLLCVLYAGTQQLQAQELYSLSAAADCVQLFAPVNAPLRLTRGGNSFLLHDGELLAARGGQLITLMPDAPVSVRIMTLRGVCADTFLPPRAGTICYPGGGTMLKTVFTAITKSSSAEVASSSVYRLLLALHRLESSAALRSSLPPVVNAALAAMREQFAFLGSIAELAGQLGISQEYLTRVFSAALGITPGKYLLRLRIEYAKQLLQQGGHTVGFVSEACGFTNANYFARVFRGITGRNPAEYRDSVSSDGLPETLPDALYIL